MTTTPLVVAVLLVSSNFFLLNDVVADTSSSGSLWERSHRMSIYMTSPSSFYPIPATSTLECLRTCQLSPVCQKFCFVISSNTCFADTNIMVSSSYDNPDIPCYFRIATCSPVGGYSLVNGQCMKIHDTSPAVTDYSVAAAICSGEGGHLLDVRTSQDRNTLTLLFDHHTSVLPEYLMTGAKKSGGEFYWSDGSLLSSFSYMWDNGQPGGSEDCVAIRTTNLKLHDIPCQWYAFVCQTD